MEFVVAAIKAQYRQPFCHNHVGFCRDTSRFFHRVGILDWCLPTKANCRDCQFEHTLSALTDTAIAFLEQKMQTDIAECKDLSSPVCFDCNQIRDYEVSKLKSPACYVSTLTRCTQCAKNLKYYNSNGVQDIKQFYSMLYVGQMRPQHQFVVDALKQQYAEPFCSKCQEEHLHDATSFNLCNSHATTSYVVRSSCTMCSKLLVMYDSDTIRHLTERLYQISNNYMLDFCISCNPVRRYEYLNISVFKTNIDNYYRSRDYNCHQCKKQQISYYTPAAIELLYNVMRDRQAAAIHKPAISAANVADGNVTANVSADVALAANVDDVNVTANVALAANDTTNVANGNVTANANVANKPKYLSATEIAAAFNSVSLVDWSYHLTDKMRIQLIDFANVSNVCPADYMRMYKPSWSFSDELLQNFINATHDRV